MKTLKQSKVDTPTKARGDPQNSEKYQQQPDFQQLPIPQELTQIPNWVLHRNKAPYQINGFKAKVNDPSKWKPYAEVLRAYEKGGFDGIGFVFTKECGITGIDLDKCVDDTGEIVPEALEIIKTANSYTEWSKSGKGFHILVKGELTKTSHKHGMEEYGFKDIEFYDTGRFFIVTGNHLEGTPKTLESRQEAIDTLHSKYFTESIVESVEWHSEVNTATPRKLSEQDERIIQRAIDRDEIFTELWEGNSDRYDFDESRADLALCSKLLRIKDDPAWVEQVFYASGLYRADKWERRDYRERTIRRACNRGNFPLPSLSIQEVKWRDPKVWDECSKLPLAWFADAFIGAHGQDWRFIPNLGRWYHWTGQLWKHVEDVVLLSALRLFVQSSIGKYCSLSGSTRKKLLESVTRAYESSGLSSIEKSCRVVEDISVNVEELDKIEYLLTCRNCTIDLRTLVQLDFDREHYITKSINGSYDPSAKCPKWERFIKHALNNDSELIRYVQKCVGYTLLGGNPKRKLWLVFDNKTATGKSTFLNVISALIGDYSVSVGFEAFASNRKDLEVKRERAMLHGKRLVTISECDEGYQLSVNAVKQVTGNDPLNARNLNEREFTFKPQFKVWFATNKLPRLRDADEAYWDRARVIPFRVHIPEQERIMDLDKRIIESELDGVLMWALQGLNEYHIEKGFGSEPEQVQLATRAWQEDTDQVYSFTKECCETVEQGSVSHADLFAAFQEWWKSEYGEGEICISPKSFSMSLVRINGFTKVKRADGIYFKGLQLKPLNKPEEQST